MTPTPNDIRAALDTLGIDPELVREWSPGNSGGRVLRAVMGRVREAVAALDSPPVPVTRDTPAGTVIHNEGWSVDPTLEWTDGTSLLLRAVRSGNLMLQPVDGWVEVSRPDPVTHLSQPATAAECDTSVPPVEVGQTRLMPVTVEAVGLTAGGKGVTFRFLDGDTPDFYENEIPLATVASWPLAPGGERP